MARYNFITVDFLLSKFSRELKETSINESDIIEWIGEALAFMKCASQNEEAVAILPVNNYTAVLPSPIQYLIQVAKLNDYDACREIGFGCNCSCEQECDCEPSCLKDFYEPNSYIDPGTFTRKYSYADYLSTFGNTYRERKIVPVRLANNKFFNTLVCKENDLGIQKHYKDTDYQYSIIGDNALNAIRTSFKEGWIMVAYVRPALDEETGYPLIPDEANHLQAINYYVRWKISEALAWVGREGYAQLAIHSEERWLRYIRQANNTAKMPTGIDDYEDLKNQSLYLIPRTNRYSNYFGTLTNKENLRF